jgi:predicted Zn-dependent protease
MLPPANAAAGTYHLQATYMDRRTGKTAAIAVPTVELKLDAAAPQVPNTLLIDPVSQLRSLAAMLPKGLSVFADLFSQIDRLNRFNPDQDYLNQATQAATYRLQQQPDNLELAYTLTLAHILKREADPAIAALRQVIKLSPNNPYTHGYLDFVNLYAFRPQAAQTAIADALNLNSKVPEFHALKGVAALMQFKVGEAWQEIRQYQILTKKK